MAENDPDFKDKVKKSFSAAKEDISDLKSQIKDLKELILTQNEQIKLLRDRQGEKDLEKIRKSLIQGLSDDSSIGNEGVHARTHAFSTHSFTQHSNDIKKLKELFSRLTKQELKILLAIYQMEEENKPLDYSGLSTILSITEGCVRWYISKMMKRGIPILRIKVFNKSVTLRIPEDVLALNLKQYLEDLYYGTDKSQSRLSDL